MLTGRTVSQLGILEKVKLPLLYIPMYHGLTL